MHIVLTVDPEIPVPPRLYGGIERVVDLLARGLLARGHEVTLFANPDSQVPCLLVGWQAGSSAGWRNTLRNAGQLWRWFRSRRPRPTVVHSFARLAYLMPLLCSRVPKVQSYQRYVTPRSVRWGHRLARGTLSFTACSKSCASGAGGIGSWDIIYNAAPVDRYEAAFEVPGDAPLVFLGRLERIKGPHHAIAAARHAGRRLLLAGNVPGQPEEQAYCNNEVLSQCDGRDIVYVGPVDDRQKNELLRQAAALLFPIEWEEPFGIVMIESLACGTPVIAFPRGAVPEVVSHGVTGFLCTDVGEMAKAVARLPELSRRECRRAVEERFSADVIVGQYEALYQRLARKTRE
jgi:glycosyltransferase involved in cell wall biosynthesis